MSDDGKSNGNGNGHGHGNGNGRTFNTLVVVRDFAEFWMRHLNRAEITEWMAIWQHANHGSCRPGSKRIREMMGHERNAQVRIARRSLAELGLIIIKADGGGGDTIEYEVPTQLPPAPKINTSIRKRTGVGKRSRPGSGNDPLRDPKSVVPGSENGRALIRNLNNPEEPKEEPRGRTHAAASPPPAGDDVDNSASGVSPAVQKLKPKLPDIPVSIASERFTQAWVSFQQHRREIRHPLTPTCASKILKKCEEVGEAAAVEVINTCIEKGWQGLVWDQVSSQKGARSNGNNHTPKTSADKGEFKEPIIIPTVIRSGGNKQIIEIPEL